MRDEVRRRCTMLMATYGACAVLVTTPQLARELDFADLPHKVSDFDQSELALDEFDAQSVLKRLES